MKTKLTLFLCLGLVSLVAGCCTPVSKKGKPSASKSASVTPLPPQPARQPVIGSVSAATGAGDRLELKTESPGVAKQVVPDGQVTVRKIVVSEVVNVPVTIYHDEIEVVRTPANHPPTTPFGPDSISLPLTKEVAGASPTARVTEVITLKKKVVGAETTIPVTVRTEKVQP